MTMKNHHELSMKPGWDIEMDIAVVGSGAAASAAAVASYCSGASVVILEKSPALGGTTAKSGGQPWIPNNFALRAQGVKDEREDCLRFMARGNYPQLYNPSDPLLGLTPHAYEMLGAYYDNAAPAIDFLMKMGACQFVQSLPLLPDYLDHVVENKVLRGRLVAPTSAQAGPGIGADLIRQLHAWIMARKITVLTGHRVSRILTDESGRVVGVEAIKVDGSTARVHARRAVIFGSGGYTHHKELMLNYQKGPTFGGCAVISNTGDFIFLSQAVGAQLGNMNSAWNAEVPLEQALEFSSTPDDIWQPTGDSMMLVNKYGLRVVNEKRAYNDRSKVHFIWDPVEQEYPNQVLCMIYDQRTLELYAGSPDPYPIPRPETSEPYVINGQSWTELGDNIRARVEQLAPRIGNWRLARDFNQGLMATVQRFNQFANDGVDRDFHRGDFPYDVEWHQAFFSVPAQGTKWPVGDRPNITIYPFSDSGPYYCILVAAGTLDTNGGPKINKFAQVLDAQDKPIPGLYGAGNCIAAPMPYYIAGGSTIGNALTFGYVAGSQAAREPGKPARKGEEGEG
jgi:3-oxosteroid 1-dehydrogenase